MNQFLNPARAPAIGVPPVPAYEATHRDLTKSELRKFRPLEARRKAAKAFFDPARHPITRLRAGALICFDVFGHLRHTKLISSGVVLRRRGPVVEVVSTYRLSTLTLNERHPLWQEYRKKIAARKVERFIAKQRYAEFRKFLNRICEACQKLGSVTSNFAGETHDKTCNSWPNKQITVGKLLNLLRSVYG